MRQAFVLVFCVAACGSTHSGGDMGKAEFSYAGFLGDEPLDQPFLDGSQVTIRIRLHSDVRDTPISVTSGDSSVVSVRSFGRGTDRGEWQSVVLGAKVGSAKIALNGPDGKALDTISLSVADPAKIVAPTALSMSVGGQQRLETRVEDKDGHTIYVSSSLEWTLDADVATFYAPLDRRTGQTHNLGSIVNLRGNRPGAATLHGQVGKVSVDLPVSVAK